MGDRTMMRNKNTHLVWNDPHYPPYITISKYYLQQPLSNNDSCCILCGRHVYNKPQHITTATKKNNNAQHLI